MDDNEDFDFDDIVLNVCETSTCDVQPYAFEPCAAADVSSKSKQKSTRHKEYLLLQIISHVSLFKFHFYAKSAQKF